MEPFTTNILPTETGNNRSTPKRNVSGFIPFTKAFQDIEGKNIRHDDPDSSVREHAASKVEYIEHQGVVNKIIVTCGCGEVTEIDCFYKSE